MSYTAKPGWGWSVGKAPPPVAVGHTAQPTTSHMPGPPASADPFNTQQQTTVAQLGQDLYGTLGQLQYGDQRASQDFGFGINEDPSGQAVTAAYNPDGSMKEWTNSAGQVNPFSKMQLLQRAYEQRNAGDTNSYAAQGQLYSGALQNAANASGFDQLHDQSDLRNQFMDYLNSSTGSKQGALSTYNTGVNTAAGDKLQQLLLAALGGGS